MGFALMEEDTRLLCVIGLFFFLQHDSSVFCSLVCFVAVIGSPLRLHTLPFHDLSQLKYGSVLAA